MIASVMSSNLLNAASNVLAGSGPIDNRRVILFYLNRFTAPKIIQCRVFELDPDIFRNHSSAGQDGNILPHGPAVVTETGGPDRADIQGAPALIYKQCRQCLALNIFAYDAQGFILISGLL
jgi:hypothetical protein